MNKRNLISSLLVFLMPIFLVGQSVVGVVSDGDKHLVGANVVIEGTNLGTVSDNDGLFNINEYCIDYEISHIGFQKTLFNPCNKQQVITLRLQEAILQLLLQEFQENQE